MHDHFHDFHDVGSRASDGGASRNEARTWAVVAITLTMMVGEIAAGILFGSMALVADGLHMATHAAAMLVAAFAYAYARRHVANPRFTFGTGKVGDLAGFASAVVLGVVAVLIATESFTRLNHPHFINLDNALAVALLGLGVNLLCAWILRDDHHHGPGYSHAHGQGDGPVRGHRDDHANDHDHHHHHGHHHDPATPRDLAVASAEDKTSRRDNNHRGIYLHVLADTLTSVLAIIALLLGGQFGWLWLDPVIGIVGGAVIGFWSLQLMRDAGRVLVDHATTPDPVAARVRGALAEDGDQVTDLRIWRIAPGRLGVLITISSNRPQAPAAYKNRLADIPGLSLVLVEVNPLACAARLTA